MKEKLLNNMKSIGIAMTIVLLSAIMLFSATGCIQANKAGTAQGLTLLTPKVALGVDTRTNMESEEAYEFLTKVMTVESKPYSGQKPTTRHESYVYYDQNGKELFRLLDYGDGRHYDLTIGSNVTSWTFDLKEDESGRQADTGGNAANANAADGSNSSNSSTK